MRRRTVAVQALLFLLLVVERRRVGGGDRGGQLFELGRQVDAVVRHQRLQLRPPKSNETSYRNRFFFCNFFSWSNKTKTATHVEGQFQIGVAAAGRALGRRHQLIEEAAQRNLVALLAAAKTKKNSVNENWVTFRFDQHELRKNHKQLIKKSVEFRRFSLAKKKTLG